MLLRLSLFGYRLYYLSLQFVSDSPLAAASRGRVQTLNFGIVCATVGGEEEKHLNATPQ